MEGFVKDLMKNPIAISLISLGIALLSFYISYKADSRSEKLYIGQRTASIQITPLAFEEYYYDNQPMGRITLQVTNYTGFQATNLRLDTMMEGQWIMEWVKAAVKGLSEMEKKGELSEKLKAELIGYRASLSQKVYNIAPNKSIIHQAQGGLRFDRKNRKIITIRVGWTSENGAQFDKIFKYELISTPAYGSESLTLIPLETEGQHSKI
jgi:hypothetical protein